MWKICKHLLLGCAIQKKKKRIPKNETKLFKRLSKTLSVFYLYKMFNDVVDIAVGNPFWRCKIIIKKRKIAMELDCVV